MKITAKQVQSDSVIDKCGFCLENDSWLWQDTYFGMYFVRCGYCKASGPHQEGKEAAVKSWKLGLDGKEKV